MESEPIVSGCLKKDNPCCSNRTTKGESPNQKFRIIKNVDEGTCLETKARIWNPSPSFQDVLKKTTLVVRTEQPRVKVQTKNSA